VANRAGSRKVLPSIAIGAQLQGQGQSQSAPQLPGT
jgi:hypothetical protein